uniref:TRF2/HOY1 PH-like domain-containing protein n=1 Tax=Davidia involucrata TaxID=16924 RepID=A0A5B6YR82_DAVIN
MKLSEDSIKGNHESDHSRSHHHPKMDDFVSQTMSEKLKASNFPASVLKIGSWERISTHEGDLIAKCYCAKQKLVWEVLEGALKSKIEIQWYDILAIRAIFRDDEPGLLAIELNQPPLFFRETNPSWKHTIWQPASDFTGGQAPFCRRHYIKFPPGTLDEYYEKLLQCNPRLFMLSQKPFPSLESPYFYSNIYGGAGISFDFNGCRPEFPPVLQYPIPSIPTPPLVLPHHVQNFKPTTGPPLHIMDSNSPLSVTDFLHRDEKINNYAFENQEMAMWGQGVKNIVNILGRGDQIQGLPSNIASVTQADAAFPCQDYDYCHVLHYGEEAGRPNRNTGLLSDIENQLLADSQVVCSDERKVSLLEPLIEDTNTRIKNIKICDDHSILSPNEHPKVDDGVFYSQPIHCFPPQVSDGNLMRQLIIFKGLLRSNGRRFATVDAASDARQ